MSREYLSLFIVVLLVDCVSSSDENVDFTIGALLSSEVVISQFNQSVESVRTRINGKIITFSTITDILSSNALTASKQFCRMLAAKNGRLFALVVSNPPHALNSPPLSVSFIAALYGIPVIGVSSRHAIFSDKYAHSSFLRTVPPYSQEAEVWLELIVHFNWHEIVLIHSNGQEAKALLSQLERQEQTKAFKITRTVAVNTAEEDIVSYNELYRLLDPVRTGQTRSIFLFVTREYSEHIIDVATRMGLFDKEWAWVFSEQCLGAKNLPQGILSVRLTHPEESHHVDDAANVATQGILNLLRREPDAMLNVQSVKSCDQNLDVSELHGNALRDPSLAWFVSLPKLYKTMISVTLEDGQTGHVQFDSQGDRVGSVYDIVNAQLPGGNQAHCHTRPCSPSLVPVGTYGFSQKLDDPRTPGVKTAQLSIDVARIHWPGHYRLTAVRKICLKRGQRGECANHVEREVPVAPPSFKRKTHLKVVTIQSTPFVNRVLKLPGMRCNSSDRPDVLKAQVDCTHTNATTGQVTEYCCYGYCIDLLRRLANRTGLQVNPTTFTFDLHLVGDGQMGEELTVNDTKVWNGIVGELVTGLADLAVAPMTITPERLTRIDFTKPFKYLGITMLVKRERSKSNLASFLQPFESTLWVLVGVSVNVVAFLLYILDHFSALNYLRRAKSRPGSPPPPTSISIISYTASKNAPGVSSEAGEKKTPALGSGQLQPAGSAAKPEDNFTLSSSMWFTWGILLNSGISEETPKAFSTRALGMVWAGFAMIIVASYTANLAAFLVLDRPEASISGIDDARLRNPQRDFTFATVRGSPVELYFKSQVEYVTIYRTMEGRNVETVEEGIQAVKSGALKAFIWDSARLNYEASHDCELVTAGEVFGRTGYALAMKPGNPWLYELSQAVLSFHEPTKAAYHRPEAQFAHCGRTANLR
uniref:Glutamate [NMDA] receptor subunit 1 n=1 Tax=Schistocephalus solidus TaxID=70667 RepID=A0A0X3P648_SCHSO